ncbi:glycosyltransferase family 4 protein [uncultured Sphingomonas sp.]|uniref:glycosyltransferase family 4 protein n=1 Tax=uncultured Sphingomonas sp. TaxID=158754 RepID=UPI0025F27A06|nr:glycosyltransferase family 4 protein [uncultured Sphingomonas sp.]
MRICFVSRRFFPAISGMSVYALNLLEQLVAAGHDVTMVSQYRGDPLGTRVYGGGPPPNVPGVKVIGLEQRGEQDGGDFERDIAELVETIVAEHRAQPFDLLHAQYGYPTGWAALLASQRTGVPNLVSIQGGDGHWVGSCCETHRLVMVRVLNHAGALLIGGWSFAEEVRDRLGTSLERFTVVPGAVDTNRFTPATARSEGAVSILYHGRVDRRKGVLDFLHALQLTGGEWPATISGIGPDLDAAKALAEELGLTDRVTFTGYADYYRVPEVYRGHDIFVSPTYAEGFSNTILEALASGLAVLSCRSVGVVDCLRDGENGLLVEPGDRVVLAKALTRLVDDAQLRRRLAATSLEECRRTYSWDAVGRQIMGVYEQLAGTTPDTAFDPDLPLTPCHFRAEPHLL